MISICALRHCTTLHARVWREVSPGKICGVQAGPGTVDRERGLTMQGWTPLVLPRNIKRGHLSHDELDTVRLEIPAKLVNYMLQPGGSSRTVRNARPTWTHTGSRKRMASGA